MREGRRGREGASERENVCVRDNIMHDIVQKGDREGGEREGE